MKLLFTIIIILITKISLGQAYFQKTYSGSNYDEATEIVKTDDGGYIISGITKSYSAGLNDMYIIKLDSYGNKLWDRIIGGNDVENAYSIIETLDGGFAVVGSARSYSGNTDVYLVKLNISGVLEWEKTFGGTGDDEGQCISQLTDSSYVITGNTNSFGSGLYDFYLLKIDKTGGLLNTKTFGGTQADKVWEHIVTPTNEILIAGSTQSFGSGGVDGYLVKTDLNGNLIWSKAYGISTNDRFFCIENSSDGNYILGGASETIGNGEDWWFSKISTSGTVLISNTYGGSQNDQLYDIAEDQNGSIVMFGLSNSYNPVNVGNAMLLKSNSNGNLEWCKTYSDTEYSLGRSFQIVENGYFLAGLKGVSMGSDIYLIRTTSNGSSSCSEATRTPNTTSFSPFVMNAGNTLTGGIENIVSGTNNTTLIGLSTLCEANCSLSFSIENDTLNCFNDNNGLLSVSSLNGQSPYSYLWDDNQIQTTSSAANLNSGMYILIVTDNNGCVSSDTALVIEPSQLIVNMQIINTTEGKCDGSIELIPSGGVAPYTYLWSGNLSNTTTPFVDSLCEMSYCVTITDFNNCSIDTCVNVILGIEDLKTIDELKIYPNPSKFILQFKSSIDPIENITIYNLSGEIVFIETYNSNDISIDVSKFVSGYYIAKVNTNRSTTITKLVFE